MRWFLELLNLVPFPPAALLLGYLLDFALGDPERPPHPVRWIGSLITTLEKHLRKLPATPAWEKAAGVMLVLLTVSFVYGAALAVLTERDLLRADWLDAHVFHASSPAAPKQRTA